MSNDQIDEMCEFLKTLKEETIKLQNGEIKRETHWAHDYSATGTNFTQSVKILFDSYTAAKQKYYDR